MGGIVFLLAILAMPAQAQRQERMRGPGGPNALADRQRTREVSADVIIRLRERLNLSEEQVARVKEAQQSDRQVRDALRLERRGSRDQLRDEEITREQFREELERRRSIEMDGMRAYRETLEGILTDEQRSQMRGIRRQANRGRGVGIGRPPIGRMRGQRQPSREARAQRPGRNMRSGGGVQRRPRRNMRPPRGERAFGLRGGPRFGPGVRR